MRIKIGVDLGGTKIEVIAIDHEGVELHRERVATPRGDYLATLNSICKLIEHTESICQAKAISIGVGIPGAISTKTGLIKNANSTCLIGQALDKDLETRLNRAVRLANDADCFALSEATDGNGQGYNSVFGVILGTGVGAGIVINGSLLSGPNSICGEWGHNPLPWLTQKDLPGRLCYCGKHDCIETFISGPGFTGSIPNNKQPLSAKEIFKRAREGDESSLKYSDLYMEQLAKALASIINILDPDVIVLGGGLSNIDEIYTQVPPRLEKYVFSDSVNTPIIKAKHGDSSGVRGAAWL